MHDTKGWWILLVAALLLGCANARVDQLDAALRAYERAIRWSDYKAAFALAGQPNAPVPDFERLQHIRVTSYDKIGAPQMSADGMKLVQVVEIRFVNVNRMADRVLTDKQVWEYAEAEQRWKLTSPFPAFIQ
jgi:hypothetical protein